MRSQIQQENFIFVKSVFLIILKKNFLKNIIYCGSKETAAVKMPIKNSILKFKHHYKKLLLPFVIYADFECFTIPVKTKSRKILFPKLPET